MTRAWRSLLSALLLPISCAPLTDEPFTKLAAGGAPSETVPPDSPAVSSPKLAVSAPIVVAEGAGVVELPLRLTEPAQARLSLDYEVTGIEAQQDCQTPDFEAANGRVEWAIGASEAQVRVWIGDDDLAERDERFEIRVENPDAAGDVPLGRIEVVIADNDRSALLDAQDLGVSPGETQDQSRALQDVLDQAAASGRGVVTMAPGDYEISSVTLSPGTTLSADGVRWHRPALSAADVIALHLNQAGAAQSAPTLVEGLTIDGRRDEQGAYLNHEREEAHLVELHGDASEGGVARATLERVHLLSGTASGLFIGPSSDATVCNLSASELWRDALTLNGGASRLRLRGLNATATQGTGLWLGAREAGYGDSYRIDVEAEDLQVGAGDVEIEASDSSAVTVRRLTMTQAPLRVDAPGGSIRIEDSVLVTGIPSVLHNHWALVHDVEVARSTIIASESVASGSFDEAARKLTAVSVTSQSFSPGPASPGKGRLAFTDCHFELAADVEADDMAYAVDNPDVDATIVLASTKLDAGFADWFTPTCVGCSKTD
ncbi:MAG TPA: hypothetical protein VHB79_03740 [Polyangiaceae bacterium]|nr:hypothetical protein [Polyangiaceae bacterium]